MTGVRGWAAPVVVAFGLLLTVLAYRPALEVGFVFDDISSIVEVPSLHWSEVSLEGVKQLLTGARLPRRAVANVTFALNHVAGGLDPRGYHVVNLLIHLAVGAVLVWLSLLYLRGSAAPNADRRDRWLWAAVPAVLFLVHPLTTQAVTYAVQRMSSLAALFCLLSFAAYLSGRRASSGGGRMAWLALAVVSWLLALGTKENALLLPLVIATWEWSFHRAGWRDRLTELFGDGKRAAVATATGVLGLAVLGLLFSRYVGGTSIHLTDVIPGRDYTGLERVLTQARVQVLYLGLLFWPSPGRLNLDHDVAVSRGLLDPPITLLAVAFWIAAVLAAVILARRRPALGFPLLAYVQFHLVEAGPIGLDLMFEHRMYLPMAMLVLLGAAGLAASAPRWRSMAMPAALAVALPLAGATLVRNRTWVDPLELHRDIARKSPNKARAQHNLGVALLIAGQPAEATAPLERAVALDPDQGLPWGQLGHAYLETGRFEEAEAAFRRAFTLNPLDDQSAYNVGLALERAGRVADAARYYLELGTAFGRGGRAFEAVRALRRAVELNPENSAARNQLGSAYVLAGRLEPAVEAYREAVRLDPTNIEALYNLGLALERTGDARGAAIAYRQFLAVAPPRFQAQIDIVRDKLDAASGEPEP